MTNNELKKLANNGDVNAQYEYGYKLFYGESIKQNIKLGIKYLSMAMDNGHKEAKAILAEYFFDDDASTQGNS